MKSIAQAITDASRYSQFVRQHCERYPTLLSEIDLISLAPDAMMQQAHALLMSSADDDVFQQRLRQFRRYQMVRMAVCDLSGLADVDQTLQDASELGDVLVKLTYDWVFEQQVKKWGHPIGEHSNTVQTLIILGMGKLGGRELNYSSDIDLIFVFPEKGMTQGAIRSISNEEFFTKVGQQINQFLNAVTADGFVFRVDMRLRPFGTSGALVHSFDAFEQYYQVHGRPWERYAMVKARAMTGKPEDIAELEAMLRPFIYRRYVDFSMLEALRELKRMIALEVNKKGADRDVKLGAGGIREIEFIVQAFQLVHGGQDAQLRGRQLMPMLGRLAERHYLNSDAADELMTAYRFLRNVENRLQMWADQQTHLLPMESERMQLLAESMQFDSVEAFMQKLNVYREQVQVHFDAVLGLPDDVVENAWHSIWQSPELAVFPVDIADEVVWREQLHGLRSARQIETLSGEARGRLDAVMPLLLAEISAQSGSSEVLKRVLLVVQAVLKRSAYLLLLRESQQARVNLVKLCAASPWLTDTLSKMPSLLDQLLDERLLFSPLTKTALLEELHHQLLDVDDEERLMDILRRFKHAQVFRVAASDLTGVLPLMKVSDYLTWIAESVVEAALDKVWQLLVAKHGLPGGFVGDQIPFIVVGFGKLGGLELGYGSDLDMVYLSDDALDPSAFTTGARPLENQLFFTRLGQKLTTILSTHVMNGMAYEVDMQLRPHGASGTLVPTLASFFRYEQEQAWTWEHQALIRTRAITGSLAMQQRFESMRKDFLSQVRDESTLRAEVVSMRDKMRNHLDKSTDKVFDLKQGLGGVIDIEFIVQYWVLRWANAHTEVCAYSDNIRQLAALARSGVVTSIDENTLAQAYQGYRAMAHRQAMSGEKGLVSYEDVTQWREAVANIWHQVFVV